MTFLKDIVEFGDYLFGDTLPDVDADVWADLQGSDAIKAAMTAFRDGLTDEALTNVESFKALAKTSATDNGLKMGAFMKPLRLVITHRDVGAELFDTLALLGVQRCTDRLNSLLA